MGVFVRLLRLVDQNDPSPEIVAENRIPVTAQFGLKIHFFEVAVNVPISDVQNFRVQILYFDHLNLSLSLDLLNGTHPQLVRSFRNLQPNGQMRNRSVDGIQRNAVDHLVVQLLREHSQEVVVSVFEHRQRIASQQEDEVLTPAYFHVQNVVLLIHTELLVEGLGEVYESKRLDVSHVIVK